jgi:hypothetical protein
MRSLAGLVIVIILSFMQTETVSLPFVALCFNLYRSSSCYSTFHAWHRLEGSSLGSLGLPQLFRHKAFRSPLSILVLRS